MISVGIDVSKNKSMICIIKPYGEIVYQPFEISHTKSDFQKLFLIFSSFKEDFRIIMESTGYYHFPLLNFLLKNDYFVCVVNALVMNKYCNVAIRKGKTDKKDSIKIANFGIDFWFKLQKYTPKTSIYQELNFLSRQYHQFVSTKVKSRITLISLLDKVMPNISSLLLNNSKTPNKNKLNDFVDKFIHYDNITKYSEKQFIKIYNNWAKKEGYIQSEQKAKDIYSLALNSIPTLDLSNTTTILVHEAIRVLNELEKSTNLILSQMKELAKQLKEYELVLSLNGVGEKLSLLLIAEIGDITRFHSKNALIAYCGIDSPPHQSGVYSAKHRRISKRGNKYLRSICYEIMTSKNISKKENDVIYNFMQKKISEGKAKNVAKIAGINKFLKIYYAKVKEVV